MLWAAIGVLLGLAAALATKIHLMRKSAGEIQRAFSQRLTEDTNTLMDISSRDAAMRGLAEAMNGQLRALRAERRRCQQGDRELKEAVTNISHDLRTPLTAMLGYLDLLERAEDMQTVRRYAAVIRERGEAMKGLTEELFRYSVALAPARPLNREPVSLNRAVEESAAAFYAALTARGIVPAIQLPAGEVVRSLDRAALDRVLENLLQNALKYSDGDLEITLTERGTLTISNRAAALDAVQVGRLFDRFYTVDTARPSTGLGLAIARTLTEQMGGTLTAQYTQTRLTLRLTFPEQGKLP
ncbi:MAG: HAMP domain-containing histidine kinase [Oscillospiraceae bacterium]|nr:HAMP domain-containing histidine kinase [Oscillospiraceae bacterium]